MQQEIVKYTLLGFLRQEGMKYLVLLFAQMTLW